MRFTFKKHTISEDDSSIDGWYDKDFNERIADEFAKDIESIIDNLIFGAEILEEDFTSKECLKNHFKKHCIGKSVKKKSKRNNVLYDFTDASQYKTYEDAIDNKIANSKNIVKSLYDYKTIIKEIRKLFEGSYTFTFSLSCGFRNNKGPVSVSLNSFATNVTMNYQNGNTINICVQSKPGKTISLYAVDAEYLETAFNKITNKYSKYTGNIFTWNR